MSGNANSVCSVQQYCLSNSACPRGEHCNQRGFFFQDQSNTPIAFSTRYWLSERQKWDKTIKHYGFWSREVVFVKRSGSLLKSCNGVLKWRWFHYNVHDHKKVIDTYPYSCKTFLRFCPPEKHSSVQTGTKSNQRASIEEANRRCWRHQAVILRDPFRHKLEACNEALTIIELALWKKKILERKDVSQQARARCRTLCGADKVIPFVLPFLLPKASSLKAY